MITSNKCTPHGRQLCHLLEMIWWLH